MNILITGIAGQLGNRLSEKLTFLKIKHQGIGRTSTYIPQPGIKYMCADISDIPNDYLKEYLKDITHVIHFADVISDSKDFVNDLSIQLDNCLINTIKLLSNVPKTIQHFSFASSVAVYGTPKELPIKETTPLNPENIYGFSKVVTEQYINFRRSEFPFPISILRIGSIYGPGAKPINQYRSIPNMINTVLKNESPYVVQDGSTYRDYMYIDDCINACLLASFFEEDGTFNIASGKSTSIKEIAQNIIDISKKDLSIIYDYEKEKEWSAVCDITKMKTELYYTPKFTIEEGLKLTYNWHKANNQ